MTMLLVIRHGHAGDAEEFASTGRSDDERPLSEKGMRDMPRVAKGLTTLVEQVDLLAASPLVRARQTAEFVATAYGITLGKSVELLRPSSSLEAFVDWIAKAPSSGVVAIVGHDPHLSRLVTWLMSGVDSPNVVLKKGGCALLEFERGIDGGAGALRWLLTPSQLIARRKGELDR